MLMQEKSNLTLCFFVILESGTTWLLMPNPVGALLWKDIHFSTANQLTFVSGCKPLGTAIRFFIFFYLVNTLLACKKLKFKRLGST